MSGDDVRDLLAAWALDAVDDIERAAVERAMRADPALADEGRALRETAAVLAVDASAPAPDAVRATVLDRISALPQAGRSSAPGARSMSTRRPSLRQVSAVAAAFLLGAAIPTGLAISQSSQVSELERQTQALDDVLGRPDPRIVQAEVRGGGSATAIVADGAAVFTARGLPALEEGDYQLWIIAEGSPESAGLLTLDSGGATVDLTGLTADAALAVTVEPRGGSLQPTTDPVVVLAAG